MCPKCQKSVTQYVAAASLPKEITKRGTTYIFWPGLFIGNFVEFMISHIVASGTNIALQLGITENEEVKIFWDFTTQTDREITQLRSDITVHDKNNNKVLIIVIAVPGNSNVKRK